MTDFWGAFNSVICLSKQKCLLHLLRDLSRTRHYHHPDGDWPAFHQRLRRLIRDGMRLKKDQKGLEREFQEICRRRYPARSRRISTSMVESMELPVRHHYPGHRFGPYSKKWKRLMPKHLPEYADDNEISKQIFYSIHFVLIFHNKKIESD